MLVLGLGLFYLFRPLCAVSPLHYAAVFNKEKAIEVLIENGFDKNLEGKDGVSPLDLAISENSRNAVTYLHALGAKTNLLFEEDLNEYLEELNESSVEDLNDYLEELNE